MNYEMVQGFKRGRIYSTFRGAATEEQLLELRNRHAKIVSKLLVPALEPLKGPNGRTIARFTTPCTIMGAKFRVSVKVILWRSVRQDELKAIMATVMEVLASPYPLNPFDPNLGLDDSDYANLVGIVELEREVGRLFRVINAKGSVKTGPVFFGEDVYMSAAQAEAWYDRFKQMRSFGVPSLTSRERDLELFQAAVALIRAQDEQCNGDYDLAEEPPRSIIPHDPMIGRHSSGKSTSEMYLALPILTEANRVHPSPIPMMVTQRRSDLTRPPLPPSRIQGPFNLAGADGTPPSLPRGPFRFTDVEFGIVDTRDATPVTDDRVILNIDGRRPYDA